MTHTRQVGWIVGMIVAAMAVQAPLTAAEEVGPDAEPALEASAAPAEETPAQAEPAAPEAATMAVTIQDNMDVALEYTLTVEGDVVDTTQDRGPFHYIHGQGQIVSGLERELIGLHVGDTKEVTISPADGYGEVDPAAFIEVPKEQLPNDVAPTVGMVLQGVNPDGRNFRAKINEVKDASVVLDLNHPLAGKTLNFQVKVTAISSAPSPAQ